MGQCNDIRCANVGPTYSCCLGRINIFMIKFKLLSESKYAFISTIFAIFFYLKQGPIKISHHKVSVRPFLGENITAVEPVI